VQLNLVAYNFWNNAFVCYCYCIGFYTVLPLNAHHVPQLDDIEGALKDIEGPLRDIEGTLIATEGALVAIE
ncbi:hypothetical protein ACJX0J_042143, partial [Zea mays]